MTSATLATPIPYVMREAELAGVLGCSEDRLRRQIDRAALTPALTRELLTGRGFDYSFRKVAHMNLRGGIGKTTASISLASRACQYGFRTCLIDLDPQGSASLAFDRAPAADDAIFYDVWEDPAGRLPGALVEIQEGFSILPSSLENGLLDASLSRPDAQKRAVAGVAAALERMGFDLVVFDCPPALGTAVISTICAADTIVIPAGSDPFSLKGIELTLQEARSICRTFGLEPPAFRILYSRYDRRERIADESLETLRTMYDEVVLPTVIRTSTEFAKALSRRETVFASHRASKARTDYDAYARHLLGIDRTPA